MRSAFPLWFAFAVVVALGLMLLGFGVVLIVCLFAVVFVSVIHVARRWWRGAGVQPDTKLQGAEAIALDLPHPYLLIRATATESGRVTILVDGVAKELSIAARTGSPLSGIEQKTGDVAFDVAVRVTGNSLACRSLLDGATRDALRGFLDRYPGLVMNAGALQWSGRPTLVENTAREFLELGSRLISPDLLAGLEKSALTDRAPVMRLRALDLLVSRFASAPETRRIAMSALADTEPAVRLHAAMFLGPEGHDELAALAGDVALAPDLRSKAVQATAQLPRERAAPIVREALKDRRELVAMSAIRTVGRLKLHECNNRLGWMFRKAPLPQQLAIVEAAAATNHESAEAPLLIALEEGTPEMRLAAVRALGPIGTVRAIEPLLLLRGAQILAGEIGPAATAAVSAIQSRLAGAGAGQLALAETAGGEMSFPGAERGSLTVPASAAGELALSQEEVEGVPARRQPRRGTT